MAHSRTSSNLPYRPTQHSPLKFTLRLKSDEAGNVISRKARYTTLGNKQIPQVHYDPDHISSPVADRDAVRCAFALTAGTTPKTEYWDLESAFLHEILDPDETIYVHQPPQFYGSRKHPGHVGVLMSDFYGIKQPCKIFTSGLAPNLKPWHFRRLTSDICTFMPRG